MTGSRADRAGRAMPFYVALAGASPASRRRAERMVSLAIVVTVLGTGAVLLATLVPRTPEAAVTPGPQRGEPRAVEVDERLSRLERRVALLEVKLSLASGAREQAEVR